MDLILYQLALIEVTSFEVQKLCFCGEDTVFALLMKLLSLLQIGITIYHSERTAKNLDLSLCSR